MPRHLMSLACCACLLFAPALALSLPARAAEPVQWWGNLNLASKHFGDERKLLRESETFKEFNPGLGVEMQWQPRHAVAAGFFRNSFGDDSLYALYQYTPLALGRHVRAGGMLGVVTGYPGYNDGGLAPGGGLIAKIENARFGANLIFLPQIHGVIPNTLGLQLKSRFR